VGSGSVVDAGSSVSSSVDGVASPLLVPFVPFDGDFELEPARRVVCVGSGALHASVVTGWFWTRLHVVPGTSMSWR